ncbi:agmatine deiminase family protein [Sulfurimonas sp. HSL3-7]|uniref:agmatine deiminase family protein n=1 Tax=Sulfonitrofixus jiaomeiensis TaxID=3131938 RepID=UPI0031F9DAD4
MRITEAKNRGVKADRTYLPAEFEEQSFVQLIFPHSGSDWAPYLEAASETFVNIATAIARFEKCLIVCDEIEKVKSYFSATDNIDFITCETDDTWARDCSGITVIEGSEPTVVDFTFTGWGGKFDASLDNAMTAKIANYYGANYKKERLILEGGAIESNGEGVLLTTTECLLNPNRNVKLTQKFEIENILKEVLGTKKVLWLDHGYLAGDDTDSHVDTLARFADRETILYVKCSDEEDEHYDALSKMERDLQALRDLDGEPFKLIPLPMTDAIYYDGERLPATYANFLIVNGAVIVPTYSDRHDEEALSAIKKAFPEREVVGVECSVLVRQHGSLHCVTMQFPKEVTLQIP